jgi:hypothetical protein
VEAPLDVQLQALFFFGPLSHFCWLVSTSFFFLQCECGAAQEHIPTYLRCESMVGKANYGLEHTHNPSSQQLATLHLLHYLLEWAYYSM